MLTLGSPCRLGRPHTVTSFRRLCSAVSGTQGKIDVPGADTVRCSLCCFAITPSFLRCFIRYLPPICQVLSVQMCRWTFDMHSHQSPSSASYWPFHHPPPLQILVIWAQLPYKNLMRKCSGPIICYYLLVGLTTIEQRLPAREPACLRDRRRISELGGENGINSCKSF